MPVTHGEVPKIIYVPLYTRWVRGELHHVPGHLAQMDATLVLARLGRAIGLRILTVGLGLTSAEGDSVYAKPGLNDRASFS
jgi:hypothetical protein